MTRMSAVITDHVFNKLLLIQVSRTKVCLHRIFRINRHSDACKRDLFTSSLSNTNNSKEEQTKIHPEVNKSNNDTLPRRPVSLLGLDAPKTARFWRSQLRKESKRLPSFTEPVDTDTNPTADDLPVFLRIKQKSDPHELAKHFPEVSTLLQSSEPPPESPEPVTHFPYQTTATIGISDDVTDIVPAPDLNQQIAVTPPEEDPSLKRLKKTVSGLIKYLDEHKVENISKGVDIEPDLKGMEDEVWRFNYGTPDPSIPSSRTPCGGCGAIIHCQDASIPGYIPSESFKRKIRLGVLCQRCLFLKEHNVALNVTVASNYYAKIISKIKYKTALVLLLVDLTDFPCSIWPGIVDLIGKKCPIIVVGTKVDLLPRDEDGYLSRVQKALVQMLNDTGVVRGANVLDVHLISAKTYFGVESLITKIYREWRNKGDIFMVGCTNVGKSTLFNALLQSDLCYVKAVDLVQRATTSVWPGTTLNLLKFPIHHMSGIRLASRRQRLIDEQKLLKADTALRESMYNTTNDPQYACLMGRLGVTIGGCEGILEGKNIPTHTFCDPNDKRFSGGHFCYDTPGAVYKDQILDLLTAEELLKTLPKEMIIPRTFSVRGLYTLFIGGLARIDLLQVQNLLNVFMTVFSSHHLPVHIVKTEDADLFYSQNLGALLEVPSGGPERLSQFPKLQPREFQCTGTRFDESCADVVLSSAGWVSISLQKDRMCRLIAYTPEGRGCYLRQPSLLPFAVRLKGRRIRDTPAFENRKCSITL